MIGPLFWIAGITLGLVAILAIAYELDVLHGGDAAGLALMVLSAGVSVAILWLLTALAIVAWQRWP